MTRYDFTDASDFLVAVGITPEELYSEVVDSMGEVDPKTPLWHTLLTLADFIECIVPAPPSRSSASPRRSKASSRRHEASS